MSQSGEHITLRDLWRARPGQAILNLGDIPDLYAMKSNFNAIDFLDLCAMIEASVLYEELVVLGSKGEHGGGIFFLPLIDADVINPYSLQSEDPVEMASVLASHPMVLDLLQVTSSLEASAREREEPTDTIAAILAWGSCMGLDVAASHENDTPLVLSSRFAPIYTTLSDAAANVRSKAAVYSVLPENYKKMSASLAGMHLRFSDTGGIVLPPIAFEVLKKCDCIEEIADCTLEVRDKFKNIRRRFVENDALLADEGISLKDKVVAFARLQNDMRKFSQSYEIENFVGVDVWPSGALGRDIAATFDLGGVISGLDLADVKLNNLFERIIGFMEKRRHRLVMSPLYRVQQSYLSHGRSAFLDIIERVFGHSISEGDVVYAERYRSAFDGFRNGLKSN